MRAGLGQSRLRTRPHGGSLRPREPQNPGCPVCLAQCGRGTSPEPHPHPAPRGYYYLRGSERVQLTHGLRAEQQGKSPTPAPAAPSKDPRMQAAKFTCTRGETPRGPLLLNAPTVPLCPRAPHTETRWSAGWSPNKEPLSSPRPLLEVYKRRTEHTARAPSASLPGGHLPPPLEADLGPLQVTRPFPVETPLAVMAQV